MIVIGTAAGYMTVENVKRYRKVKKFELDGWGVIRKIGWENVSYVCLLSENLS